jgi:Uma2 family endonuclease
MSITRRYTIAELEQMTPQNGERLELIDGELFVSRAPSWEHQYASGRIQVALANWAEETGVGTTLPTPGIVYSMESSVIPDVVWTSWDRLRAARDGSGHFTQSPELVVEVMSPGTDSVRRDRVTKLRLYSRKGVREYWIVNLAGQSVDVFRREGDQLKFVETVTGDELLESPALLPGFQVHVVRIWPPVL